MLGIRTLGHRMVGADKTMELGQPPWLNVVMIKFVYDIGSWFLVLERDSGGSKRSERLP